MALLLVASGLCGPVVVSEVMYHPYGTDVPDEFVEIVNITDYTIDLAGWRLADLHSIDDLGGSQLLLWPGQIAVIFEADYDTATGTYRDLLPAAATILFVDDNAIGNGLSNSGDTLFLVDAAGDTVDQVGWNQDITPGYSLEKVILDDCTLPGNWRPSTQLYGTPGASNSVVGHGIDLALSNLDWEAATPPRGFRISATISNQGIMAAEGKVLADETEVANIPSLEVGESRVITFGWEAPETVLGLYSLTVRIAVPGDYDTTNNSLQIDIPIPAPAMAVVVNEIMYMPLSGEPEWVELVNTTTSMVNLKLWEVR
ncbi:MAG: lamin tail domain-containing protein, partial [Candidatus Neomarinimicrobiota bacterium]